MAGFEGRGLSAGPEWILYDPQFLFDMIEDRDRALALFMEKCSAAREKNRN